MSSPPRVRPDPPIPTPPQIVPPLLAWLALNRRDLPWRRDREPYRVWVAEIMLQQTQAATVGPYFERWLARFPDVQALAAAPLDDVLKAWEGLGYYARARNLRAAAQEIAATHGGQVPAERAALLRLPGIGRYTAGAILSLAFGQAEPVLDGNVRRVLCRLYDVDEDPAAPAVERRLWGLAAALVEAAPPGQAGDLNEALMELGALVCAPGKPDCARCPLAVACLARARGVAQERPRPAPRARTPHYAAVAAIIQDAGGRYLVARRPPDGLLGGLWEFPGTRAGLDAGAGRDAEALLSVLRDAVATKLAIQIAPDPPFMQVRHAYTHFRITLHACRATLVSGEPQPLGYAGSRWVTPSELDNLALPVTDQRIAAALARNEAR